MTGISATAHALTALPAGRWRVLHSVDGPERRRVRIDHLVVGPAGVFVIGSERPAFGEVAVDTAGRGAALAGVADAAIALAEMVPGMDPHLFVPVLCTSDDEQTPGRIHDVLVCSTTDLAGVLMQQEETLTRFYVDDVFGRLQRALPSAMFATGLGSTRVQGEPALPMRPRRVERSETTTKHLPWTPGTEVSPAVQTALISIAICLVVCALISGLVWPVVDRFVAFLVSLG
jgi:hypothetical protein